MGYVVGGVGFCLFGDYFVSLEFDDKDEFVVCYLVIENSFLVGCIEVILLVFIIVIFFVIFFNEKVCSKVLLILFIVFLVMFGRVLFIYVVNNFFVLLDVFFYCVI